MKIQGIKYFILEDLKWEKWKNIDTVRKLKIKILIKWIKIDFKLVLRVKITILK